MHGYARSNWTAILLVLLLLALVSGCAAKREIIIDPTGRGTYTSIREGLRDWEPGQSITIREGVYNEQIILQTYMQIIGEGRVVVEFTGDGPAMHGRDVSSVLVRNITLRRSGEGKHATVRLRSSDVHMDRCAIQGGDPAGVESQHFGMLTLTNSLVSDNGWAGIYLHGQARAVIEQTTIESNERGLAVVAFPDGVPNTQTLFREDDMLPVVVRNSEIINNTLVGVLLTAGADVRIEEALISGNALTPEEARGDGDTGGSVNLDLAGVLVRDRSTLAIAQTQIVDNLSGVVFQAYGNGAVVGNTIERNLHYGVVAIGSGKPEFIGNIIRQNGSGAVVREGSQAVITENQIVDNRFQGLEIGDSGLPMIERNVIAGNAESGIFVFDNGKPTVRFNTIAHNGWYGLLVARQGRPVVFNNTLVGNQRKGVWFTQKAEGVFANNVITNSPVGLSVMGNGEIPPRIVGNLLWECEAPFEAFLEAPPSFLADPQFANPKGRDYRPRPGSPLLTLGEGKAFLGAFGEAAAGF